MKGDHVPWRGRRASHRVADPKLVDPTDVLLRITTSAVCGSDLHQYTAVAAAPWCRPAPPWATRSWAWWRRPGAALMGVRPGDRVDRAVLTSPAEAASGARRRLPTSGTTTGRAVSVGASATCGRRPGERISRAVADHLCEKVPPS